MNPKKVIILFLTTAIMYIALISDKLLPDVTLEVKDAIIITFFVLISLIALKIIGKEERDVLKHKIHEQHSQMQAIINNSNFIMYLKDLNGKILLCNQLDPEIFGYNAEQIIGKSSYEVSITPKISKQEDIDIIKQKKCIVTERKIITNTGYTAWFRIMKSPVLDEQGNVINISVILNNINEEKELEERKNTFVATMAHDLKTPTIAQIRALDLLLKNTFGVINNEQKEIINQIKSSCNYMYDLIFSILDTYLYDNGQTKINAEDFNIVELINETTQEISNLLIEKNQKIVLLAPQNIGQINADRFQLKRVIVNFLSNSIYHGYKNSEIIVTLKQEKENIAFDVQNNAPYIPPEKMSDLYQKYKSSENAKFNKTGTGLGLYLSKQIVNAHNGSVYATSNENNICNFGFSIPIKQKCIETALI